MRLANLEGSIRGKYATVHDVPSMRDDVFLEEMATQCR